MMNPEAAAALALLVIFIASVTRSTFGFGEGLIAMPLLSMLFGVQIAAPWIALISVILAGTILIKDWKRVHLGSAGRLVVASFAGIPIGLYFVTVVPESLARLVLALVVMAFSTYGLARPWRWALTSDRYALLFGLLAGILGGAYNTQGLPMVIYGTLRQWTPEQFRATLQGFFFPTGLLIVCGHGLNGRLTPRLLVLFLMSLPVIALAALVGRWLHVRIREKNVFVRYVYGLLLVIGAALLLSSLRS